MSYAIIRNVKYKMANMQSISRHNERQNSTYGNKDIDTDKSALNYHLKQPIESSYEREFYRLREENGLKGNLRLSGRKQSNIACEFVITSDNDFFRKIGGAETERFFREAYNFACNKCGEQNIISAVVHMDETTPHMHLTYIPVVMGVDRDGIVNPRINCSEFWKGVNSYGILQNEFYMSMKDHGFDLERGETREEKAEHLTVNEYKAKTLEVKANDLAVEVVKLTDMKASLLDEQEQVKDNLNALQGDLEHLEGTIDKVKDFKVELDSVSDIEVKEAFLDKNKVVIAKDDFRDLKRLAKKGKALEHSHEVLKHNFDDTRADLLAVHQDLNASKANVKELTGRYNELYGKCKQAIGIIKEMEGFMQENGIYEHFMAQRDEKARLEAEKEKAAKEQMKKELKEQGKDDKLIRASTKARLAQAQKERKSSTISYDMER